MDYKKVIEDFNSGKLDKKVVTLVIDNDGGYWSVNVKDDEKAEAWADKLHNTYGSPDGYSDVVDILQAAGVNAEWC